MILSGSLVRILREWLWRVHERGLDNISDRKPPGARGILGPEEIEIVRETLRQPPTEHGFEQGAWLLRMIAEVITKKLKKHCRPRTIRRLLHRMGFSYVKPRTVPQVGLQNGAGGVHAAVQTAGQ